MDKDKQPSNRVKTRWREFAYEYIKDFHARAAYKRCVWTDAGNDDNASASASRLLKEPVVQEYIDEAIAERNRRANLGASEEAIIIEQLRIAMSDLKSYMKWDHNGLKVRPSDDLTEDESRALSGVEIVESYDQDGGVKSRKFKFSTHSKSAALESLSKHLGMYEKNNRIVVEDNRESQITSIIDMLNQAEGTAEAEDDRSTNP